MEMKKIKSLVLVAACCWALGAAIVASAQQIPEGPDIDDYLNMLPVGTCMGDIDCTIENFDCQNRQKDDKCFKCMGGGGDTTSDLCVYRANSTCNQFNNTHFACGTKKKGKCGAFNGACNGNDVGGTCQIADCST